MEQNGTQPPGSRPVRHRTRKPKQEQGQSVAPEAAPDPFDLPPMDPMTRVRELTEARDPAQRALENDLGWRVRRIRQTQPDYVPDFTLDALHELLQMGMPLDSIAKQFNVTVRTIYNWRQLLQERYRAEALNFDPMPFFGRSVKHYEGIKKKALQMAATADNAGAKRGALALALQAENDMHRMLAQTGFYDAISYKPPMKEVDDPQAVQSNLLADLSKSILADFQGVEDIEDAEVIDGMPKSEG